MPENRDHCAVCAGYYDAKHGTLGGVYHHQVAVPAYREGYQVGAGLWFTQPGTAVHPDNPELLIDPPAPATHVPTFGDRIPQTVMRPLSKGYRKPQTRQRGRDA